MQRLQEAALLLCINTLLSGQVVKCDDVAVVILSLLLSTASLNCMYSLVSVAQGTLHMSWPLVSQEKAPASGQLWYEVL